MPSIWAERCNENGIVKVRQCEGTRVGGMYYTFVSIELRKAYRVSTSDLVDSIGRAIVLSWRRSFQKHKLPLIREKLTSNFI